MDLLPVEPDLEELPPAPPEREPFWGYLDVLLVAGLTTAAILAILVVIGALVIWKPSLRDNPGPILLPGQLAIYGGVYLAFRIVFQARYSKPVMPSLGWRSAARANLPIIGLGGAALAFTVSFIATLLHTPQVPSPIDKFVDTPLSLALFGIFAVTIAPLFEELFFRGFLQPLFCRTFGVVAGILVTAALFGGLHAPEYSWAWQYAFAVALAGAVFGWIRFKTNSIIPSTVMHGCYNAVFVIALAVTKYVKH